jgi:hypothetical protein
MNRDDVQRLEGYIEYLKNEEACQKRARIALALGAVAGGVAVASGAYLLKLYSDGESGSTSGEEKALISQAKTTPGTPDLQRLPAMTCFEVADDAINVESRQRNYCSFNSGTPDDDIIRTPQGWLPARFILETCKQLAEKICAIASASRRDIRYVNEGTILLLIGGGALLGSCLGICAPEKKLAELPSGDRHPLIRDCRAAGLALNEEMALSDARKNLERLLARQGNQQVISSPHAFLAPPSEGKIERLSSPSPVPEHKVEVGQGLTESLLPQPTL